MQLDHHRLLEALPGLFWTARPDGACDFVNGRWLAYTGMTAEQATGSGWAEAIHPDDRARVVEVWFASLASTAPAEVEARFRRHDGAYRWFQFRASPVKDAAGNVLSWCGNNLDVEDRRRLEEAQRPTELSWLKIIDNIPGLVATMSAGGEVEFLNQRVLDYFGRTHEDLKNWSLIGAVHPDDLPRVIEARLKSIESGELYEIEHRCRGADGVYRWFQVRGLPVHDAENRVTAWCLLLTDIDDRKKAEEALRSNERNLQLMIDVIPTLIQVSRPDGSILSVNQAVLDYYDLSLEEMQREDFRSRAFHPDDVKRVGTMREAALKIPQAFEYEQRARSNEGSYRWFLVRYKPLLDEQGRIERWYVAAFDIEDRKKAEEALRANERNLRIMIDSIPASVHVLSASGTVLYVNKVGLENLGLTLEDIQSPNYHERIFHPDDFLRLHERRTKAIALGEPFESEQRVRVRNGDYRWFLIRYNPVLDENGALDRWYLVALDIEARKRAEDQVDQAYTRLAEAQRLSKTGSFITDLLADDHNWSEEAYRIFDFEPDSKVSVARIRELVHPDDLASFDDVIARGAAGMDADFVFRVMTSRGVLKYIRGIARVINQISGRPLFIGALQDVTESKTAEESLNKARAELSHVARLMTLSALTASIAHEVNQPISGIITNAATGLRMLASEPPNIDGVRATLQRTLRDGNRAADVIQHLRNLYARKQPKSQMVDLNDAAQEVLSLTASELQRGRVALRTEFDPSLPPVRGDRIQLQQVVQNLILNAADAMREIEDRSRDLYILTVLEAGNRARLSVVDSGVGIDPRSAEKLFEAFYTTKSHGMGIGLAISRSIIESHEGRLWASANDGPGATFSFWIPCEHEAACTPR